MPAASEPTPRPAAPGDPVPLPHTWRPLGVRLAGWGFGVSLLVMVAVTWFSVPREVRDATTVFELTLMLLFVAMGVAAMTALMRCKVVATGEHLVVVNGFRRREFDWPQVVAVSLPAGAPWATLDLADGTTVSAMGIQGSDGDRARTAVRELRRLLDLTG